MPPRHIESLFIAVGLVLLYGIVRVIVDELKRNKKDRQRKNP